MIYTKRELTVKNKTVGDAILAASARAKCALCLDAVKGRDPLEQITIAQLNDLADRIVDDSGAYGF